MPGDSLLYRPKLATDEPPQSSGPILLNANEHSRRVWRRHVVREWPRGQIVRNALSSIWCVDGREQFRQRTDRPRLLEREDT